MEQLTINDNGIKREIKNVSLAELPDDVQLIGPAPTPAFIKDVEAYGINTPVSITFDEEGDYRVIAGRRRIKAARAVGEESIPAIIMTRDGVGMSNADALAVSDHAMRADNIAVDIIVLKEMSDNGDEDKEIAAATGLRLGTVRRYLRLINGLIPQFLYALARGKIARSTAEELSRLPEKKQQSLFVTYKGNDSKLTAKEVKAAKKVNFDEAVKGLSLPGMEYVPPAEDEGAVSLAEETALVFNGTADGNVATVQQEDVTYRITISRI